MGKWARIFPDAGRPFSIRESLFLSVSPSTRPVVVLTGTPSGIGHATALAFAHEGVTLVLASRGTGVNGGFRKPAAKITTAAVASVAVPGLGWWLAVRQLNRR